MNISNTPSERIKALAEGQRAFFATGYTREISFRKQQLKALRSALQKWEKPLCDALWTDLHKSYEEAFMTEIGLVFGEISDALKHVGKWARRRKCPTPITGIPSRSYIIREPLGCALIVSPWNYPVQLLLSPLVGAIAAGCTAILKPSPYVPNVSAALQQMIEETFEPGYIAIVQGNREVNTALFGTRFDLVFFTGSPALGKVVMEAQSKYLTPLVLELGGKSPCIVDKDADIELAARRIVWGKCLNSGQTCIAPDYLFLHEDIKEAFVEAFKKGVATVGQTYLMQQRRLHFRLILTLHDNSRQLLMVANHHKTVDGGRSEDAQDLRFQNLRSLIKNGDMEVLESEKRSMAVHRGNCADEDGSVLYLLHDLLTIGQVGYDIGKQVFPIGRCA